MSRILVVDDEAHLAEGLRFNLAAEGHAVEIASDGADAARRLADPDAGFELVILDLMLPEMNGFEVLARIRERDADLSILMVTAKGQEEDKVRGLGLGADDYVVKPFGVSELLARVDAALRRKRLREVRQVIVGEAVADFVQHRLLRDGESLEVTSQEMKLLRYLVDRDGRLLTRQQILDGVWGADYYGTERTVDNFINRLRAKIERDPRNPRHILTVRGAGYRFSRDGD